MSIKKVSKNSSGKKAYGGSRIFIGAGEMPGLIATSPFARSKKVLDICFQGNRQRRSPGKTLAVLKNMRRSACTFRKFKGKDAL